MTRVLLCSSPMGSFGIDSSECLYDGGGRSDPSARASLDVFLRKLKRSLNFKEHFSLVNLKNSETHTIITFAAQMLNGNYIKCVMLYRSWENEHSEALRTWRELSKICQVHRNSNVTPQNSKGGMKLQARRGREGAAIIGP